MTAERLLNAIAAYLRPLVEAEGGVFALSATVDETLSLLAHSAGRFRVVLQWQQERQGGCRGAREMTVLVIVQMGSGVPSAAPGDLLSVQRLSGGGAYTDASLMRRASEVCAWVLGIHFPAHADVSQDWPVMQPGRYYWLHDRNVPTVQRAHEFTIAYAQDVVTVSAVSIA